MSAEYLEKDTVCLNLGVFAAMQQENILKADSEEKRILAGFTDDVILQCAEIVKELPTEEDVVHVTRCGKCWYGRSVMDGDMIECHFHTDDLGRPLLVYRDPDWFCGSGEPPEEDEKQTTMPDTDEEW